MAVYCAVVDIVPREGVHKWLGCMLSTQQPNSADVDFNLHAACKALYANIRFLCDKSLLLQHRLPHDAVVIPVACYAAAHCKSLRDDFHKFDVIFRRLLKSIIAPPGQWIEQNFCMTFCTSGTGEFVSSLLFTARLIAGQQDA